MRCKYLRVFVNTSEQEEKQLKGLCVNWEKCKTKGNFKMELSKIKAWENLGELKVLHTLMLIVLTCTLAELWSFYLYLVEVFI